MRGRPQLYTAYADDMAIFNTATKRTAFGVLLVVALVAPFTFLGDADIGLMATAFAFSIGAIGLNLLSGYAGQVSLGHAFFLGVGAYTAIALSSPSDGELIGFGIESVLVWLPAAGLVAAAIGLVVAPVATRLRGLYLGIVTLGLVFLGDHIFREWTSLTGGAGLGRSGPEATLLGIDLTERRGEVLGIEMSRNVRFYLLCLLVLLVLGFLAKNLARSRVGRAFAAVRDQDIAAEVMGVNLSRTKATAFAVSSFYAGVAGALLALIVGQVEPSGYNLLLSVLFIAMILVGGPSTIAGSIMGALVIGLLPRLLDPLAGLGGGEPLGLNGAELEQVFYGLLLIVFIIVEPRGLFGLWIRARNYWKAFPFSF